MIASKIMVIGQVSTHYSFYEAIAAKHSIAYSDIEFFDEKASLNEVWRLLRDIFRLRAAGEGGVIYVEEFSSAWYWLITSILCRSKKRGDSIYICVHNANRWLRCPNIRHVGELFAFLIRRSFRRSVNSIVVVSESIREYLSRNCIDNTIVIPFRLSAAQKKNRTELPVFVSPGAVETVRRDYLSLARAVLALNEEGHKFVVHLLGRYQPFKVNHETQLVLAQAERTGALRLYKERVTDEDFEKCVLECTCLIGNINHVYHEPPRVDEIYGVTKESGVRVLADAFNIPCILPTGVPPGQLIKNYMNYSSEDELYSLMKIIIERYSGDAVANR